MYEVVMKTLYIIRGLPGSGKSTWARTQLHIKPFEADDFFMIDGVYRYQADMVPRAHEFCQRRCEAAMRRGQEVIAVANTFTRKWEYSRYLELAEKYDYEVVVHTCKGQYKNIHNVPDDAIAKMRERFEY
jgi:predicted kinase